MIDAKKAGLIVVMVLAGILAILVYWNQHLYYSAIKIEDNESKVELLSRAKLIYPLNDLVFFELGKAYFDLGIQTLDEEGGPKVEHFRGSIANLEQAIRINPASYLNHFYYAQSHYLMDYVSPPSEIDFYEQYKKSALLAGHDNEVFYEVGKVFLSKWKDLSEDDKEFTQEVLSEALIHEDGGKFEALLHIWEMNVKDYAVIEAIIPEETRFFRIYAEFLGEKSLSRDERVRYMMMAEQMEFQKADMECAEGNKELAYFQLNAASGYYKECLRRLGRIRLYQDLGEENLIDPQEFRDLNKNVNLRLAKVLIRQGSPLSEVEDYLREYLVLEDKISELNVLENFLQDRGVITERLELKVDNLDFLAFQVFLYTQQARHREIASFEKLLKQSFVAVPEEQTEAYVRILQLIGNSYQRSGSLYGAIDFYNEALEIDPDNLMSLLGIRAVYQRINDEGELRNINRRIEELLSANEIELENPRLEKEEPVTRRLILDGRETTLELELGEWGEEQAPFLSVVFNGRVVWENYLENNIISIPVQTLVGENTLRIVPLNTDIDLILIRYN